MKIIKTSLAFGTSAVMMLVSTGLVFGSTAKIKNTGANSVNKIVMSTSVKNMVLQTNKSSVANQVMVSQNTGGNSANKNTGNGNVDTGDTSATVVISNGGSSNELSEMPNSCGCETGALDSSVSKTGYKSINVVVSKNSSMTSVMQSNFSTVSNGVGVDQNTGLNEADKNTGNGRVDTGSTEVEVDLVNEAASNTN